MTNKTVDEILSKIGIKSICERIADTESQASIAKSLNIAPSSLSEWLSKDVERSACAREARLASAYKCDDLALAALNDIADDATQAAVTRQREIASHQRWRAKTRNPVFHDKVQTELSGGLTVRTATDLTDDELAAIALQQSKE
jgi:hypothetical protein